MGLVRLFLLAATIIASLMADAQTVEEERARIQRLTQATDMIDMIDNMTPDEIAELMGFSENDPEALLIPAAGQVLVRIDVSIAGQTLSMTSPDGAFTTKISSGQHDWSRGRGGYRSARGCYTPRRLRRMHYSKKYDNAPMPNSVFYTGGYAIHATYAVRQLGRPASHGCIRVNLPASRTIFDTVSKYGQSNTLVCVN